MDPASEERFEKIELKLSEHDEKIIAQDKTLTATKNLLLTGIRMLVDVQVKIDALTDSHARLYGQAQGTDAKLAALADAQALTELKFRELAEAQKRTEESLKRFLDRSSNGRSS